MQLQKTRKLDISEADYFRIIRMKTAALISACTACGASSVTEDLETIARMKDFGENIGVAFQIKDYLLDYTGIQSDIWYYQKERRPAEWKLLQTLRTGKN